MLNKHVHPTLILRPFKASNTSPQRAESVDFNGVGFVLIERTVFVIFGLDCKFLIEAGIHYMILWDI